MKSEMNVRWIMLVGVVFASIASSWGCACSARRDRVTTDQEREPRDAKRIQQAEAVRLAEHAALSDGYDLDLYTMTMYKRIQSGWWIHFKRHPRENPTEMEVHLGGDNFFSVTVSDDGTVYLLGGR